MQQLMRPRMDYNSRPSPILLALVSLPPAFSSPLLFRPPSPILPHPLSVVVSTNHFVLCMESPRETLEGIVSTVYAESMQFLSDANVRFKCQAYS